MTRGFFIGIFIVGAGLAFSSCGSDSPGSPDTTITAPTIQSPANGSTVDTLQPTLTVGNATGGTATLTYRFEVARDSGFGDVVVADEGIGQGSGTTSWRVPVSLVGGETYHWRSRANAAGQLGPYSQTANFTTEGGFITTAAGADGLLIFDPLTSGSSLGEVGGGSFNTKGWMATAANTYIRYEVPTLQNGFVEFDVTNLRNPNPRSEKRNLLIMWDPTAGDYTENPYRVHIAKYDTNVVTRWHVRLRWISRGQERNTGIDMSTWDPNRIYNWRMEWGGFDNVIDSQQVRVLLDGQQIMERNYDPIYNPSTHWIELGMAPRNETLEQAIFSNVRIGIRRP
jgi:hypothetical protein